MAEKINFSNRGHILAAVGAAVGIANLVLFPARVFNYGGMAFVLVFVLCTFILGVPLMIAETALGKSGQSDAVKSYARIGGNRWGYAGVFGLITTGMILSFYVIVAGWALYYLYNYTFQYQVIQGAIDQAIADGQPSVAGVGGLFGGFVTNAPKVFLFSGLFMGLTVAVVANNVQRGIEWVSKRFVPLLMILILFLIGATFLISGDQLNYSNFGFDFGALFRFDQSGRLGIIEAVGQSFFSLSLGACGMVTYATHIHKDTNVVENSHYVVHTDTLVALFGGFLVIPLFAPDAKVGLDPTLVFISLVDTFNSFGPLWARIIGIAFFTLFNIAILTSTISLLEPTVNFLSQKNPKRRSINAILVGALIYLLSIPAVLSFMPDQAKVFTNFLGYGNRGDDTMGYFNFVLDFFGTFALLVGSFLIATFIRSKWTFEGLFEEITVPGFIPKASLKQYLTITLKWVVPILMVMLFVGEIIKVGYKLGMME